MSSPEKPRSYGLVEFAVLSIALILLVLVAVDTILPPRAGAMQAAHRTQCRHNLRQIGIALHHYHDDHGSLPPAVVRDERGNPMHSWRVLLLPYLDQEELYAQYRFEEAWDGPNNRRIARLIPDVYRCPSDADAAAEQTRYLALTGPGTAFDGTQGARFADFTDGASSTLAVVEAPGDPVPWMEPRDTRLEEFIRDFGDKSRLEARHAGGTHGLIADGVVRFFSSSAPPKTIRALSTIAGGENVGEF